MNTDVQGSDRRGPLTKAQKYIVMLGRIVELADPETGELQLTDAELRKRLPFSAKKSWMRFAREHLKNKYGIRSNHGAGRLNYRVPLYMLRGESAFIPAGAQLTGIRAPSRFSPSRTRVHQTPRRALSPAEPAFTATEPESGHGVFAFHSFSDVTPVEPATSGGFEVSAADLKCAHYRATLNARDQEGEGARPEGEARYVQSPNAAGPTKAVSVPVPVPAANSELGQQNRTALAPDVHERIVKLCPLDHDDLIALAALLTAVEARQSIGEAERYIKSQIDLGRSYKPGAIIADALRKGWGPKRIVKAREVEYSKRKDRDQREWQRWHQAQDAADNQSRTEQQIAERDRDQAGHAEQLRAKLEQQRRIAAQLNTPHQEAPR